MIIREMRSEDAPRVEAIYDTYWSGDFRENISKRLYQFLEQSPEIADQLFSYFVAEEGGDIEGVVVLRKCPNHMLEYAASANPAEIYLIAARRKGTGLGRLLMEKALTEVKRAGYTEAVLYSGETHSESWGFYDHLGFERAGPAVAPNGEKGLIWRMIL